MKKKLEEAPSTEDKQAKAMAEKKGLLDEGEDSGEESDVGFGEEHEAQSQAEVAGGARSIEFLFFFFCLTRPLPLQRWSEEGELLRLLVKHMRDGWIQPVML